VFGDLSDKLVDSKNVLDPNLVSVINNNSQHCFRLFSTFSPSKKWYASSGFLLSDDFYALTARHTHRSIFNQKIKNASQLMYSFKVDPNIDLVITENAAFCSLHDVNTQKESKVQTSQLTDPITAEEWATPLDFSLLELQPHYSRSLQPLRVAKQLPKKGEQIFVIGYPGYFTKKLFDQKIKPKRPDLTYDEVLTLFFDGNKKVVSIGKQGEFDATIENSLCTYSADTLGGMSGSMVCNVQGELIGVHIGGDSCYNVYVPVTNPALAFLIQWSQNEKLKK